MPVWFKPLKLEDVNERGKGTMVEYIGISIIAVGDDFIKGTMPVNDKTIQPMGILHGGASVALAETLGSLAANLVIDKEKQYCVGLDINANHIRSVEKGKIVTGTAKHLHLGRSTQVWSIEIRDEEERLICISRLTMAVLEKRPMDDKKEV